MRRDGMESIIFTLPASPSLNEMLRLAKQRRRVGRQSIPVVYDARKREYEALAIVLLRQQGVFPPREPWARWRIDAVHLARRNLLDPVEAMASLKWVVDALVKGGYVAGDSGRELVAIPLPTQAIERKKEASVTVTVSMVEE